MKYLIAIVTSMVLMMSPVLAADTPATPAAAPVQKGKLMLAKKKDHSQANAPKAKKSKK